MNIDLDIDNSTDIYSNSYLLNNERTILRNYFKKRLPWFKTIALAYCHLPMVLLFYLYDGRAAWQWYALVGLIPWVAMVFPFIIPVISIFTIISLLFTGDGVAFTEVHSLIPIAGSLILFSYFYWHLINDIIKSDKIDIKNISFLIAWTLICNFFPLFLVPRPFLS